MTKSLTDFSAEELRELLQASRQTLTSLVESLANRPDMQNAIRRLMRPDDMLETFSELAVGEPDLMRLVLQASVAALVNVQSVEAVDAEMKRRAISQTFVIGTDSSDRDLHDFNSPLQQSSAPVGIFNRHR